MLERIAIALVVLWLAAIVAGATFGGLIHLLLVAAFVIILVRVLKSDGNNWPAN
ncbi:MAG TPA: lmo0937 family membrane protein [Candidatus Didemnitutus sp.]|nr:lmo0937 family membrane protein [Candidatus Didemnitutus sp.]